MHSKDRTPSPSRPIWLAWIAIVMCVGLLSGACSSSTDDGDVASDGADPTDAAVSDTVADEGPAVDGGKLVFGVFAETEGWNPHDNTWAAPGAFVGSSIFEPLATYDSDLNAVPWLATSWTPNDDFTAWTLELRDDVTFQNGEPFDAEAVKMNIDDLKTAPLASVVFGPVLGDTEVVDDHTVTINLNIPFAVFPESVLASQTSLMLAPEMLASENRGTDKPIGTGPYQFQSWKPGATFTAVKNESYWQEGLPHLDEIEFTVLVDASAMATALQTDDIDIAYTTAMTTVTQVDDSFTVLKDWGSEPGTAITNTYPEVGGQPNPMANEHARKALAYATDQQALADFIGPGVEQPSSPFPPSSKWGLEPEENGYVSFDLDKAKEEVAAYEAETGIPLQTTLSSVNNSEVQSIVQLLQSQWAEAGIETKIASIETSALIGDVITGNYQVALFQSYSAPDPDQDHHYWSAENAPGPGGLNINFTQFTTPDMEENLAIGRENTDFETRKAAYDAIVHDINAAAVNIWTYSTPYSIIANERVHGLTSASEVPFGNYQPKTWLGELWLAD